MNDRAIIDGREYTFLETLPTFDQKQTFIICRTENGSKYICPEAVWRAGTAIYEVSATPSPLNTFSSDKEKIDFFLDLFRGRSDVYARRYHSVKAGKSGYVPACGNEWVPGLCDKKTYKCPDCPNRCFLPLTVQTVRAHLVGRDPFSRDVVGIYPMLEDDTTWLLCADFDEAAWQEDVSAFCAVCREYGLTPAVERSRSGQGAHIWFFFAEPVSAADARKLGCGLLTQAMSRRHELSFKSYDRLFPSQDSVPKGGFGNLIALPFQGQAQKAGNSLFVDDQFHPHGDQWGFLSSLPKITPEQLHALLGTVCAEGELGSLADETRHKPWPVRRTRQKLSRIDFPSFSRLMISNFVYVDKSNFSQKALNAIKRLAVFPNPDFYRKQAMRLRIYDTPRVVDCGYGDADFIALPRGCLDPLLELLDSFSVPYTLEDQRTEGRTINVRFCGILRSEQIPAAEALLQEDIGVLSATTAFGKTVIGAYLIGQRKVSTLILVHSSALLEQWKSAIEQFLEIHEPLPPQPKRRGRKKKLSLIGQIGAGKNTRSGIVDIAIMQSLFEGDDKEVKSFVAEYGMVICDECHHVAAFTFEKILRSAEAKYVYGLSATPNRQDGHQPIIFMQCGPIRYLVDAKSQAEKRAFAHVIIPRFTRTRLPKADSIQDTYSGVAENDLRNSQIVSDALALLQEKRTPLVLTQRKDHAIRLSALLQGPNHQVFLLLGSDSQKEKRSKLAELKAIPAETPFIIVATGKYVGEGFDEPRLDTLLLAMPVSWKGTLAQYAGRLHRNYEGKQEVQIYDYVDLHVPVLERMYHKRLRGYADLGYQVKLTSQEDKSSRIYVTQDYLEPFLADLTDAARDIRIVSLFLHKKRINVLLPIFQKAQSLGATIHIQTQQLQDYPPKQQEAIRLLILQLSAAGVRISQVRGLQQRCAILDHSIVWYGSADYLSFSRKDASALRFDSPEIAGELLYDLDKQN